MCGTILPLPQYVFMAWRSVKHRDNFTFTYFVTEKNDDTQNTVNVIVSISNVSFRPTVHNLISVTNSAQ
jgi:hypothetical protein